MKNDLTSESTEVFEEVDHTADWAYHVWGSTLEQLFTQATKGLYFLANAQLAREPRIEKEIELKGLDRESLLIAWLNELLYYRNLENLGFDHLEFIQLDENALKVKMTGSFIQEWRKDIKAATYHNLVICPTEKGFEVTIVLDV